MININTVEVEFKEKKKIEEILSQIAENPPIHINYVVDEKGNCYVRKIIRVNQNEDKV
jgi:hypothetical protein